MVPSGSIVFQDLLTQSFVFFSSLSPDDVCELSSSAIIRSTFQCFQYFRFIATVTVPDGAGPRSLCDVVSDFELQLFKEFFLADVKSDEHTRSEI